MSKLIIEMLGPKVILCALLTLCVSHVAALDFANSKWIWTSSAGSTYTVPPLATADFRQDFTAPPGKIPVSANIIIAADNNYTLYVNGELIGQGYDWEISQGYCVKLDLGCNVFAVAVQNQDTVPTPAAFIAAINVTYADSTSSIIVTDDSWLANSETAGFESVGFDDITWPHAVVVGNADSAPWHVPSLPASGSALTLSNSYWIWNTQVPPNSPTSNAPAGNFAFRKTFKVPGGASVQSGTIVIDADNGYTLYINGKQIGTAGDWTKAQRWTFTLDSPVDTIVLAIAAVNTIPSPAGFIVAAAFDAKYCDYCSTSLVKVTDGTPDGTWKFNLAVPTGFEQPNYDDSAWDSTIVEGIYGVSPWGSVPIVNGN